VQPVSAELLERCIFSRPTFERKGFVVAIQDDVAVGFVHVGFGATEDLTQISTDLGVTCMLMVDPAVDGVDDPQQGLAGALLARGEEYLRRQGATVLYAGAIRPLDPFYLGMYGGSELPGILSSDAHSLSLYKAHDYEEIDRVCVLQCDLTRSRTAFNRRQLHLRREMRVAVTYDPPTTSWWEAVTLGDTERTRFELIRSADEVLLASVNFWNMEPLASSWGIRAAGMMELDVVAEERRTGIATCLLGEAFRCLKEEGVTQVEAQTMIQNKPAQELYKSFGFQQVDEGVILRKRPQKG
jgi:ribosomal protein S18 acetylase RimI-like enzyme